MKAMIIDLAERSVATFVEAFLASITVGAATGLRAVAIAATAGGYAVAKVVMVEAKAFLQQHPGPPAG